MDEDLDTNDIDYLHPHGKPAKQTKPAKQANDGKPDYKSLERAIQDADGHSIYKADPFLDGDNPDPANWDAKPRTKKS